MRAAAAAELAPAPSVELPAPPPPSESRPLPVGRSSMNDKLRCVRARTTASCADRP